jgi:plasmid stability protein
MSVDQTMTSFQAPKRLVDQVRELAAQHDRSVSAEIRQALNLHLRIAGVKDP